MDPHSGVRLDLRAYTNERKEDSAASGIMWHLLICFQKRSLIGASMYWRKALTLSMPRRRSHVNREYTLLTQSSLFLNKSALKRQLWVRVWYTYTGFAGSTNQKELNDSGHRRPWEAALMRCFTFSPLPTRLALPCGIRGIPKEAKRHCGCLESVEISREGTIDQFLEFLFPTYDNPFGHYRCSLYSVFLQSLLKFIGSTNLLWPSLVLNNNSHLTSMLSSFLPVSLLLIPSFFFHLLAKPQQLISHPNLHGTILHESGIVLRVKTALQSPRKLHNSFRKSEGCIYPYLSLSCHREET